MSTPTRLALFAVVLATVFGLGLGIGTLAGPVGPAGEQPAVEHGRDVPHPTPED